MVRIWKYKLRIEKSQEIEFPENAKILTAQVQDNIPCIWAEVDDSKAKKEIKTFYLIPTGEEVNNGSRYIATLPFNNGKIIQHLYESVEKKSQNEIRFQSSEMSSSAIKDKIKGVIYGHAIGDAIGLGTEFLDKNQIRSTYPNGFSDYSQMISDKHRSRWQKGEWTDDTDQMLCILESIIRNGRVDEKDVAKRIHDWAYSGGRGLGNTVYNVVSSPKFMFEPHEVAKQIWINSGRNNAANGAVMRTSILGVWEYSDLEKVKQNTEKIAKITHFDPRCIGSCFAVTSVISKLLQNQTDCIKLIDDAIEITKAYDERIEGYLELSKNKSIEVLQLDETKSIGYTLKALAAGFWALQQDDFKRTIVQIVNQGGDADTNGAVAGGILGAKVGFAGLPQDWIDGLINKEKLDRLVDQLIRQMVKTEQID